MIREKRERKRGLRLSILLMALLLIFTMSTVNAEAAGRVSLTKTTLTLKKGKSYTLKLRNNKSKVRWSSSRKSVAVVSSKGKVTAKGKGNAVITAKVGANTYKCRVTVTQPVTKVSLSKKSYKMNVGSSVTLTALTRPTNANNRAVRWTTSNKNVATVTSRGKITAKAKGTAVITAKAADGSGKKATCKVTVSGAKNVKVSSLQLNKTEVYIEEGKSIDLSCTVSPNNATNPKLIWSSNDRSVATVNYAGKVTGLKANRSTKVVARTMDGSNKKAVCIIRVKKKGTLSGNTDSPTNSGTGTTVKPGQITAANLLAALEKMSQRVQQDAKNGKAWTYRDKEVHTWSQALSSGSYWCNCAMLARWGLKEIGAIKAGTVFYDLNPSKGDTLFFYGKTAAAKAAAKADLEKYCTIITVNKTPAQLLKEGNLKPGDICTWKGIAHTNVYAGNGYWYDAGRFAGSNGSYVGGTFKFTTFGPAKTMGMDSAKIDKIIRIK